MRKILLLTITILLAFSINYSLTTASNIIDQPLRKELSDLPSIFQFFTGIIFPLVSLGLLGALVFAGFNRLTAAGDAEKEKKSMQVIKNAIIGFVIVALSGVIVNSLCALLGVQCF